MLKVGITGGIGSGKSTVCQVFETLGIPVFYADRAARYLMENDLLLIEKIKSIFGEYMYQEKILQREKLASLIFNDPEKLKSLNTLVHPATIQHAKEWMNKQNAPYVIKEAALFFESGSYKEMDIMIGVFAPKTLRIQRVLLRNNTSEEKILERMAQQTDEEEKMKRCDFVIVNDDKTAIIPQVLKLHEQLVGRWSGGNY